MTPGHAPRALALRSVFEVCAFIDDLPRDVAGEIVFTGRAGPSGAVFVEAGRVCWAAAGGLARRLSDLLAASAKLDVASMDSLYDTCKRRRAPLREYLVAPGIVDPGDLRSALLTHTSESLQTLCSGQSNAAWSPRQGAGYSSRFTFSTPEILARSAGDGHEELVVAARLELADALATTDWGAAFVRCRERAVPEPIALYGEPPAKVEPLLRLGRWGCSSLDVACATPDEDALFMAVLDGAALVAWRHGATVIAAHTSVHGPARLLNRRARACRKEQSHGSI